jgi:hypothetical protein
MYWRYGVVRVKTSIYIDRGLWERFREYALKRNVKIAGCLRILLERRLLRIF